MRKFEQVKKEFRKYTTENTKLPYRGTKTAVCYDFFAPADVTLPAGKITCVWTNVKACFEPDEGLFLATRSSYAARGILLANGVGIIENDYYENPSNDGNLGFLLYNINDTDYTIKKGEKVGQGYFAKFLTCEGDAPITTTRTGGFGSTSTR